MSRSPSVHPNIKRKSKLIIILLYSLLLTPSSSKETVIFEQIGQLAGATSYLHVHLTISLSSIQKQFNSYKGLVTQQFSSLPVIYKTFLDRLNQTYSATTLSSVAYIWSEIAVLHLADIQDIGEHLASLQNMLPDLPNGSANKIQTGPALKGRPYKQVRTIITDPEHHIHPDNLVNIGQPQPLLHIKMSNETVGSYSYNTVMAEPVLDRPKRVAGFIALPLAVAATAMGIYNTQQIEFLKHELLEVKENVNRLFEVVQQHEQFLHDIADAVRSLSTHLLVLLVLNPTLFGSRLGRIENQIRDRLRIATHALQAAQHRRLAVDLLSAQEIRSLYSKLVIRAQEFGCDLLLEHHSDLFQLETSLLFDGEDAHILLHVPMIPQHSLLRLFKLHPFPMPFFEDHFLIPDVKNDILAISSTDQRFSAQLSSVDLMGCHRVNQVFMCDRFGVLSRRFNHTCLGALYMQDFRSAQSICKFEIVPTSEKIYQLKKNWFVVYLPLAQTIPIKCRNGTTTELHLSRGSQKFHLSPGCEAQFQDHLVTSDLSIKMPADTLHFEWEWDPFAFAELDPAVIAPELERLRKIGIDRPQLTDLRFMALSQEHTAGWTAHFIHFAGNTVLALLILGLVCFVGYRCYIRRRARRPPGPILRERDARAADPDIFRNAAARLMGAGPANPPYQEPRVVYHAASDEVEMPYSTAHKKVYSMYEREALVKRLSQLDATYPPTSPPNEDPNMH